jgi:hypothetical protein
VPALAGSCANPCDHSHTPPLTTSPARRLLLKAWRTLVEVEWRENEKDSGDSIVRATIPGWPAEVPWPARVLQPVTQEQREEAALFPEKMFVVWYGTRQEWSFVDKDSCAPFVPGESEPGAAWLLSAVERKQFWVAEAQAAQDLEQLQEHHKEHGPGDPAAGAARTEALAGAMLQLRSGVEIGGAWVSETRRKYKRVFPSERRIKVCEFQHATPASKPPAPEEHADPADGLPRKRRGQPLPAALCCPAVPHEPGGASKKLGAGQGGSPTRPMGIKPRARKSQTPEASTAGMTPPRRKGQAGVGDRAGRGAAPSIAEGPGMSDLERQSKRRSGGGAGSFARSVRNVAASYTDFDAALKRALAQSLKER